MYSGLNSWTYLCLVRRLDVRTQTAIVNMYCIDLREYKQWEVENDRMSNDEKEPGSGSPPAALPHKSVRQPQR